ncbi:MAG: two-component system sensor histidine kinase NtrB [Nitrospirales bacterium]
MSSILFQHKVFLQLYQTFCNATQEGVAFERVFRFLHPDGTVRKVLSRAIPISSQEITYQGFNVDITALEQMRAQLSRSERLATLGQVAAGIAHEIRNPLVGIGSTTSLLMEDFSDDNAHKADLVTILNETRRLDRIVNQIVEYARPRDLLPAECSLLDVVQESINLLQEPLAHKSIDWTIAFTDDLPSIKADHDQLKQVLLNVIQNAIDALGPAGQLHVTGTEKIRDHTLGVLLEICDNGKGIDAQHLSRVFEPFFTTGKRQGTGLGLAICRNIIEGHGGEIQMRSQPEAETVVSIWLPILHQQQFSRV